MSDDEQERRELRSLIEKHCRYTGSPLAEKMLRDFEGAMTHFRKVVPR